MLNSKKKNYQDIEERSFNFAIRIIKLVNSLPRTLAATEIGRQLVRSGTAINSNVIHAKTATSKKEFIYFIDKANQGAQETRCWIKMLVVAKIIKETPIVDLLKENTEIISILITISKRAKKKK